MEICGKKYTDTRFGFPVKTTCQRPVTEKGLCSYHLKKSIAKSTAWGDRKDYRPATQQDLDNYRSLKLKNTNRHMLFRLNKGVIQENQKDVWVDADLTPDFNLFCVKI